ncbi:MAG: nitroreductase family protein [Alloprevotella sp.]|nr:nitroreductase family protein [Alloprevotella sp.]
MKRVLSVLVLMATASIMVAQDRTDCCQEKSNPVIDAIMTRTSIRQFQDRKVEPSIVQTLLRAGMAAPTARNKQPWHFVVVDKPELLAQLGGRATKAPLVILVCGDFTKTLRGTAQEFWIQDCSAATENILLAAHALGLGAVWTGAYPGRELCEKYQSILNLPATLVPLNAIVIGYPAEAPAPKDKWLEENITYNIYSAE